MTSLPRRLILPQESFYEFAFAADRHTVQAFEPSPRRYFRSRIQPNQQMPELCRSDPALLHAIQQVFVKRPRKILA
jgi:hypothetical protein